MLPIIWSPHSLIEAGLSADPMNPSFIRWPYTSWHLEFGAKYFLTLQAYVSSISQSVFNGFFFAKVLWNA